jgi:hypothetical protein
MDLQEEASMETWVTKAWANELGGRLMAALIDELYGSRQPLRLEPTLFEASKQQFLAHGKTELEHRLWRQNKLKQLRLNYLQELTRQANPGHPRYAEDYDEYAQINQLPMPPVVEPEISLEELDAEVTDWYLKRSQEELPIPLARKAATETPETSREKIEAQNDENTENPRQSKAIKKHWRLLHAEDLEGEEYNDDQLSELIYQRLLQEGEGKTSHTAAGIKNSIKKAQNEASSISKSNGNWLPVRLRRDSNYFFDEFAMVKVTPQGRPKQGEGSSKYKSIKASALNEGSKDQDKQPVFDEPPQELNHSATEATNQD